MSESRPRRLPLSAKIVGATTLAVGLSAGAYSLDHSPKPANPNANDLANQLRHPLSPAFTESGGGVVPAGQEPPVGETVSQVPGHKNEVYVQFGTDEAGYTPPSEIVHGNIPNIDPADQSPLFNVNLNPADIRSTPGMPKQPHP